jgi:hypothetical protein
LARFSPRPVWGEGPGVRGENSNICEQHDWI